MAAILEADVLGVTRIQQERIKSKALRQLLAQIALEMQIRPEHLDAMKPDSIMAHPLPIHSERSKNDDDDTVVIPEIAPECDNHPKAKFMEQSDGGLPTRESILYNLNRWPQAA